MNSVFCCFSWEKSTKCSQNPGLVNEFPATPRGQLNWTGPIANSSDFGKPFFQFLNPTGNASHMGGQGQGFTQVIQAKSGEKKKEMLIVSIRKVADVWKKDVWEFQAKSGSSGSCRLFLHFLGKIAVRKMSGSTPGSPRHPSCRHPRPSDL